MQSESLRFKKYLSCYYLQTNFIDNIVCNYSLQIFQKRNLCLSKLNKLSNHLWL